MDSNEDVSITERKSSKAQRILGTDLPFPNGRWDKPQKPRRSSLRTPDESSRQQRSSFLPFPSSEAVPPQNLRVRASSPLLGHDYRSQDSAPPLPKPSKKVHPSGSSSTLFSYFSSKEKETNSKSVKSGKSGKSKPTTPNHASLQPRVRHELQAHPNVTYQHQQAQTPPKESKRKLRPPRIDLSILFPKPRNPATQNHLLSPQRVTSSPSPVSTVASDWPSNRVDRVERLCSTSAVRKLQVGEPLPQRTSAIQHEAPKPQNDRSDLLSIPEMKDGEWSPRWDNPERTVGTSEIDLALDRYAGRRSPFSRSSVYTASREQLPQEQQRPTETIQQRRTHSPVNGKRKDLYLSPNSQPDASRGQNRNRTNSNTNSTKTTLTKKSSKSTLKNKDLQKSSVLCLSSSEDEDSDRDTTPTENATGTRNKNFRDSVATYGDYEPEIYTASTAHATVGTPTLKRVDRDRAPSTSSRGSSQVSSRRSSYIPPIPQTRRHTSNPSSNTPPAVAQRMSNQPHRKTKVPLIAEPDILNQFPQSRTRTPEELKKLKEMNRRSRVIAVTRQEQDLLEAMRVRKGKITPSIFQNNGSQADRNSVISGPSRDSFCGSDTSFLRLSAAYPPFNAQSEQGASHMDKHGSSSQSSGSDTEQKTVWATPRAFRHPLPAVPPPLTPTLPIHRFSPLPSPKPPPRGPPPAIPEDQKQHIRRRTDSSEAIMLNNNGEQRKHDLPLWSFDFDWNQDRTSVTAVH
ncbi:hypothetical protein N7448_004604 [Penicillium atrosanguineum]|nr:hypothetical protein N7448_004604 [Penicillium atrosanguineum]